MGGDLSRGQMAMASYSQRREWRRLRLLVCEASRVLYGIYHSVHMVCISRIACGFHALHLIND